MAYMVNILKGRKKRKILLFIWVRPLYIEYGPSLFNIIWRVGAGEEINEK